MKIVVPPIYERNVDPRNPFAKDRFGREHFADTLTTLFSRSSTGLVVTVDGGWGEGKTTLIKLWEMKLRRTDGFIPIYLDAFRSDFRGDAFMCIAAAITAALDSSVVDNRQERIEALRAATRRLALGLLEQSAGVALTYVTSGALGPWLVSRLKAWWSSRAVESEVEKQLAAYSVAEARICDYHKALEALLTDDRGQLRRVVFFIDELDRCRPDFAVEVLEKLKHLFMAPGVFFVLAMNREQLQRVIASAYGIDEKDAAVYLQKFVHVDARLPPMTAGALGPEGLRHFSEDLCHELDLPRAGRRWIVDTVCSFAPNALTRKGLPPVTPRGVERVLSLVAIGLASYNETEHPDLWKYIVVMAVLRICVPEDYERYKRGTFTGDTHEAIWKWLRERFGAAASGTASNSFTVEGVERACRILDLYDPPRGDEDEEGEVHTEGSPASRE